MEIGRSYLRKFLCIVLTLIVCFVATNAASLFLAADPPLSYEKIIQIYRDTRITDLGERERNLQQLIRRNKINFVPTDEVKAYLRDEGVPDSIINELKSNFASKIQYRLNKFECYGCPSHVETCSHTDNFRFVLQEIISAYASNAPRIWFRKGVLEKITGCDRDLPRVDAENNIIIDLKGESVRNGSEFSIKFKLLQMQPNNNSLYLGETSARISLRNRDEGFREAAVAVKKYVEDVFVR